MAEGGRGGGYRRERGRGQNHGARRDQQDRGEYHQRQREGGGRGGRGDGRRGGREGGRGGRGGYQRDDGGGHHHERRVGPSPYWSKNDIDQISRMSSAAAIQRIQEEEGAFMNAFTFDKNYKSNYTLPRLIKILNALCNSSEETIDFSTRKLSQVIADCSGFLMQLKTVLATMEDVTMLQNMVKICRFCVEQIPMNTIFRLPHLELKETIEDLDDQNHQSLKKLFQEYNELYDRKKEEIKNIRREKQHQSTNDKTRSSTRSDDLQKLHDLQPPNDFREIEILPQAKEFTLKKEDKPFLRPVITKGSYQSWDDYLDVHFRLLREDFMAPLREGIEEYLSSKQSTKNVHIYLGARVIRPVCLYSSIGFAVQFDIHASKLNRVRWEHSRRLIYGSLLCLSSNNFKTFFFATVVKRDPEQLETGCILLKFEEGINGFTIDPATNFIMVESTAYFEAYRHVLEGLQEIKPDQMPFTQHIIQRFDKANPIPLPLCIRNNSSFDLNRVLEVKRPISKIDVKQWPISLPEICLDPYQLNGFKMALSQELSIIQGPPGTGKTYVGLKILQALLLNRSVWDPKSNSPILVVCYTNHALDQFLDGIIEYSLEKSRKPKIVRVGGRCKSEKIKECAMANLVSTMKKNREVPGNVYRKVREDRNTMKTLASKMDEHLGAIDAMEGKILTTEEIGNVIDRRLYEQLVFGFADISDNKHLEVWLELWYLPGTTKDIHEMTEEEQLAAAMEASLRFDQPGGGVGLEENPEPHGLENEQEGGVVIDGAAFIDVVDEPQILEQERMTEGELIELGHNGHGQQQPHPAQGKDGEKIKPTQKDEWEIVQIKPKERKKRIINGMKHPPMTEREANRIRDIWQLSIKDRWRLYQYWLIEYIRQSKAELKLFGEKYDRCAQDCIETDRQLNKLTLDGADIIGMTTTGAAKHSYIFKHFHPKIVIVEEAAEVLESHVITSLCSSVQQLILIGDHKQLQPKITCFELEKYNLHVSLFERLAMKEYPIATLGVQHRMRPEIASIVANHIYDKLENHESVMHYDHVKGIGKDLFFIEHCQHEKDNPTGDQRSHANKYEAEYVAALTRHLLKQGYSPEDITILTMYRGQLFEIKQNMKRDEFGGVRVTAVDDFQGEENEIVIISLVRSNNDKSIGFLKVANRICVSLSRAKKGMYVIGNFAMLRDKKETKWPAILEQMEHEGNLGEGLPLCCQIHPGEKVIAKTPQDFSKSPEGGCKKLCGVRLDCGHVCKSPCHPLDREHKALYQCHQKCMKQLPCGHNCQRRCTECIDGCAPCEINVSKTLSSCGHDVRMKCCEDESTFKCYRGCNKPISGCGHKCQNKCWQPCTRPDACSALITRRLACSHTVKVQCSADSAVVCTEPCRKILDKCQHQCRGTCGTCSLGRLHVKCNEKCERQLNCGHTCKFPCPDYCPPCSEPCRNYCYHSKCPKKCYEPCVPCREPCKWECEHYKCMAACGEMCTRPPCNRACEKRLKKCGHPCIGLCGEDCPTLCRICDKDQVTEIFFGTEDEEDARFIQLKDCAHVFEVSGLDHWMDSQKTNPDQSNIIKFIECPKCKTPIRRSLRYGNVIKATINDMEKVKKLNLARGDTVSAEELSRQAETVKSNETVQKVSLVHQLCETVCNRVTTAIKSAKPNVPPLMPHEINSIQNLINLLPTLARLFTCLHNVNTKVCQIASRPIHVPSIVNEVKTLLEFLKAATSNHGSYMTQQQAEDAECELRRLFCLSRICEIKFKAKRENRQFEADDEKTLEENAYFYIRCGVSKPRATDVDQTQTDQLLEKIMKKYSIGGLSKSEKAEILKAMGTDIQRGAWYKCPNGHIYAIGNCGGANQEGTCPECGSHIGGTNHTLAAGNTHAREMDGSTHAAWSQEANLDYFRGLAAQFR